jgi:hypothetical protein
MAIIDKEDIIGYYVGKNLICLECFDGDERVLNLENFFLKQMCGVPDILVFCDRCGKRIDCFQT